MNLSDKPAFPRPYSEFYQENRPKDSPPQSGMTLREHYAGLALQGIMSMGNGAGSWNIGLQIEAAAKDAVRAADALIAELEKS